MSKTIVLLACCLFTAVGTARGAGDDWAGIAAPDQLFQGASPSPFLQTDTEHRPVRTSLMSDSAPLVFSRGDQPALARSSRGLAVCRAPSGLDESIAIRPAVLNSGAAARLLPCHQSYDPGCTQGSSHWALVAPYSWATAAKGSITIRGNTTTFDASLSDLIDQVKDGNLRGAGMLHMEAGRDQVGFLIDGVIASLGASQQLGPLTTANVQFDLTLLEAIGIYRIVDTTQADDESIPIVIDLLGGVRYYDIGAELRLAVGGFLTPDLGQSNNWIDLVSGIRTQVALTESLTGSVRFDVGGYGLGTSSDMAYNLTAGVDYDCPSFEGLSLFLGYRYLDIDEDHSSGTPSAFGFDAALHGPVIGFVYRF